MSWQEMRTGNPLISAALTFFFVKLFRLDMPASSDDPNVQELTPYEIAPEAVPADLQALTSPTRQLLEEMGFELVLAHLIRDPIHSHLILEQDFRHPGHPVLARLHYRRWDVPHPAKTYLFPVFITGFADGCYVVTSGGKFDSPSPASVQVTYHPQATVSELWAKHQAAVAAQPAQALPLADTEGTRQLVHAYHALTRDFHVASGRFGAIPPAEQPAPVTLDTDPSAIPPGDAAVLTQMEQLRKAKSSWVSGLVFLGISILVFLGAGSLKWEWKFVLMLIPILLFHELGHFLTMRIFGYRNLRMFFIPLFGAAVTGQRFNVAAWKQVVVSLMGPLPGILLGTVLGGIGLITRQEWMLEASLLTLILNGFNLLPILPLDGGWVVHTLYFSRHPYLDLAFRSLAGLGLLVVSITTGDRIFMFLGIVILIGLPIAYKLAQIIHRLRREELPPPAEKVENIPYQVSGRIISDLRAAMPKGTNAKTLAQQTLEIYEGIYNRPPGLLATIGLTFVHLGAIVLTLVMAAVLILNKGGDMGKFIDSAMFQPEHEYTCGTVARTGTLTTTNRLTIFGQYADDTAATAAYDRFKDQVAGDNGRLTRFGSLLMFSHAAENDAARRQWISRLESGATNVFVQNTNMTASLRIQCLLPDTNKAAQAYTELANYLHLPAQLHLIPPWHPEDQRSQLVRSEHAKARATFLKLSDLDVKPQDDPEWSRLNKEAGAARRRGELAEARTLQEQQQARYQMLRQKSGELLVEKDRSLDATVAAAYLALPANHYTNQNYRLALTAMGGPLGQLPLTDHAPAPAARAYSTRFGGVDRAGLLLDFGFLSFEQTDEGLPALADWLCKLGAKKMKFDVHSSPGLGLGEEE